jgi:hypothetical protein
LHLCLFAEGQRLGARSENWLAFNAIVEQALVSFSAAIASRSAMRSLSRE